jgi:hypothetical protein
MYVHLCRRGVTMKVEAVSMEQNDAVLEILLAAKKLAWR